MEKRPVSFSCAWAVRKEDMKGLGLLAEVLVSLMLHGKLDGMFSEEINNEIEVCCKSGQLPCPPYFPLRCYHVTYVVKHLNSQTEEARRLLLHYLYWHRCSWHDKYEALPVSLYPLPKREVSAAKIVPGDLIPCHK